VARTPSYAIRPVTGEEDFDVLALQGAGYGPDFGAAVHRLLEEVVEDRLGVDVTEYAARLLDEMGVAPDLLEKAVAAVDGFRGSDVWSAMRGATRRFTEVPVAIPDLDEDGLPTVTRGRIDLIYESPEGWHIVDYKTDEAASESAVEAIAERYGEQVRAYAKSWFRATGETVVSAGLWLTGQNRYVTITER
jgi:ATP-dependent exoDNAse (exonuclease V) beta subunit